MPTDIGVIDTLIGLPAADRQGWYQAFKPMLIDEYAKAMSSRGGVGVKQAVLKEILKLQGLE